MSFAPFAITQLSEEDRAAIYPYEAPLTDYVIEQGQCRPFAEADKKELAGRVAVLSVGSNRAPQQLMRKFGQDARCFVSAVTLHDCDIIHSACFSYYGAVPCTAHPSLGTSIQLNAIWLTQDELQIMHDTEAVGTAYDFCVWDEGAVEFHNIEAPEIVYGYSSRLGALCDEEGAPLALSKLPASARRFSPTSQIEARQKLYAKLPDALRLADEAGFMKKLVSDKAFRKQVNDTLLQKAQPMKQGRWRIITATTQKADAYL